MAKIENLTILNPADKTHLYAVAIGKGAPADVDDRLVTDTHVFKVGSQYTDLTGKKLYIRVDTKRLCLIGLKSVELAVKTCLCNK